MLTKIKSHNNIINVKFIIRELEKGGMSMKFDYSKLNGRIVEVFGTQLNFAVAMGLSERSISLKLNNRVAWKNTEIAKAAKLLKIRYSEIPKYFLEI